MGHNIAEGKVELFWFKNSWGIGSHQGGELGAPGRIAWGKLRQAELSFRIPFILLWGDLCPRTAGAGHPRDIVHLGWRTLGASGPTEEVCELGAPGRITRILKLGSACLSFPQAILLWGDLCPWTAGTGCPRDIVHLAGASQSPHGCSGCSWLQL